MHRPAFGLFQASLHPVSIDRFPALSLRPYIVSLFIASTQKSSAADLPAQRASLLTTTLAHTHTTLESPNQTAQARVAINQASCVRADTRSKKRHISRVRLMSCVASVHPLKHPASTHGPPTHARVWQHRPASGRVSPGKLSFKQLWLRTWPLVAAAINRAKGDLGAAVALVPRHARRRVVSERLLKWPLTLIQCETGTSVMSDRMVWIAEDVRQRNAPEAHQRSGQSLACSAESLRRHRSTG